ncbi:MAG TPA: AraC family transcriptional regulator [Puia sp.]|nr:AraC family transcriptional regulator [Puia sp.]
MGKEFKPQIDKLYVYDRNCLLFIKSGCGIFEVDFKQYDFGDNKMIFLSSGQYFRLLSGHYTFVQFDFTDETVSDAKKSRFLFKHLVSLSHINLDSKRPSYLKHLTGPNLDEKGSLNLLHHAIEDWVMLNPFRATKEEIDMLFDVEEIIENHLTEPFALGDVSRQLQEKPHRVQSVVREKLHLTITAMARKKKLLKAKRKMAFTDLSIKEVAYDLGFRDSDYFFKFFKQHTNQTPSSFKELFNFNSNERFTKDIFELIERNFRKPFKMAFYAGELAMSERTLARKIHERLDTSLIDLLHKRKLKEAKKLISSGVSVADTAFELGFKETSHFSLFYKKYTGASPSQLLPS